MKVIIIEDERLNAQRLEDMLHKYSAAIQIQAILPSVAESVEWLHANPSPDLVFMDIHLEDDLCFKIFELAPLTAPVIFITAYDDYMLKAFKVNSIDYLLKPVNYLELIAAVEKFKQWKERYAQPNLETLLEYIGQRGEVSAYKSRFLVSVGIKIKSIETKDVAYFYSDEKITFMVTKEGQHLPIDFSLDKLTTQIDPSQFFRISRQFLVGYDSVQNIYTHFKNKLKLDLLPKAKDEVFVSGDRMTEFKTWLGK